jgi:hypothetical protein
LGYNPSMRTLLTLLLAVGLVLLPSCSGGEADDYGTDQVEQVADDVNKAAEAGTEAAAEKVCCGGGCDTPAGYCCMDGTCGGGHKELPVWQP